MIDIYNLCFKTSFHLYFQWMAAVRTFIPTINLFLHFGRGCEEFCYWTAYCIHDSYSTVAL